MVDHEEEDDLMYKILDHSHKIPKCNNITQVSKGDQELPITNMMELCVQGHEKGGMKAFKIMMECGQCK